MKANSRKRYKAVTIALSVAAVALLAFGTVGGARAAIVNYSDEYRADFQTQRIGVALTENGITLGENDALLQNMVSGGEGLKAGVQYDEEIGAENTGAIDEYVRITLHKYWTDETNANKHIDLSPGLIKWEFNTDDWIVVGEDTDEEKQDETAVLYYKKPLLAESGPTEAALTKLSVDNELYKYVKRDYSKNGNTTVVTTKYAYDGVSVGLDADVDAVQTHNAHDAILSAWGVDVELDGDGNITGIK